MKVKFKLQFFIKKKQQMFGAVKGNVATSQHGTETV